MRKPITTICAWCKDIKDGENWVTRDVEFETEDLSHGCCPHCIKEHYPQMAEKILGDTFFSLKPKITVHKEPALATVSQ